MKLPQVKYGPVQSLGRHNVGAVASKAAAIQQRGQVDQRSMGAMAAVTADYIERQENSEYNGVIAEYQIEVADWQARHNAKQFYQANEVPESIDENTVARVRTGTDDDGVQFSEIRDDIPAHEVYPHLLKQKLDGLIKDKASKISNPNMRNAFLEKAGEDAAIMMMRATVSAEQMQQKYTLEKGVFDIQTAADNGNLAMAQFLIEQLETDELTKKQLQEEVLGRVEIYEVTQSIRSTDPETVMTMRSILEDENYSGSMTEDQRQAAIRDLNGRLTFLTAEHTAEMSKAHEAFISDANVGIDLGEFTLHDVEVGYQRWHSNETDPTGISGRERTALRARILARNARLKEQQDWVSMGEGLITNGGDPYDSNHQKYIDAYVADKQITDPRELERITIRSSIMPQVLENFLNTAALHDAEKGGETIGMAVEMFGRLSDMKPEVLREMGKEAKNVLGDTHILVRGGMPVPDAYEFSRENARIKPELREQRDRDYRELKPLDDNSGILDDFMDEDDTFFGFETTFFNKSEVAPNQEMLAQFNTHTQMHYLRTGDIALARQRAWTDMKEKWSPTGIGAVLGADEIRRGTRPMEYAPERVMAVSTAVAQERLEAFARDQGLEAENLSVMSDDRTARDGSWAIWVIDPETDEIRFHPKRWVGIDWAEEAQENTYNEAVKEAIEKKAEKNRIDMEMYDLSYGSQFDDKVEEGGQ